MALFIFFCTVSPIEDDDEAELFSCAISISNVCVVVSARTPSESESLLSLSGLWSSMDWASCSEQNLVCKDTARDCGFVLPIVLGRVPELGSKYCGSCR